jgi:hypothetical protein
MASKETKKLQTNTNLRKNMQFHGKSNFVGRKVFHGKKGVQRQKKLANHCQKMTVSGENCK